VVAGLRRLLPGNWIYSNEKIITDTPADAGTMADALQGHSSDMGVIVFDPLIEWQPDAHIAAEAVIEMVLRPRIAEMREALRDSDARLPNAYILREPRLQPWVINGYPVISLSIRSHLLLDRPVQQIIDESKPKDVLGLRVLDRTTGNLATIEKITGTIGSERDGLLAESENDVLQRLLEKAADDEAVLHIEHDGLSIPRPASALRIVVEATSSACEPYDINAAQAQQAIRIPPAERAKIVRAASDVLKNAGLIENAYNSRTHPELFVQMDFTPGLTFANGRTREYNPQTLAADFLQSGLFASHPRFKEMPIKLAVINTLDNIASDFMEAMRRQIERDFGFEIDLIRERNIRVVNEKNIASAVRVVEKEDPHAVLAFFPDAVEDHDPMQEHLKSLTLGKGIASHVIYEKTVHDPDSMALVIMGVLAKTGNAPFALTEPLEFTQLIVGLDIVRERLTRGDRLAIMTRIYRRDGLFMQYFLELTEVERDAPIPFSILQRVFPILFFNGKKVILHHAGGFPADLLQMLDKLADELGATFYPVEILQRQVPRLYGLAKQVTQAPWGSTFRLSDTEAFVVTTDPGADRTAKPLHIRMLLPLTPQNGDPSDAVTIEQVVYSVLAWTLLHYGAQEALSLPVTVQHASDLAEWLGRGMVPQKPQGDVPFWL